MPNWWNIFGGGWDAFGPQDNKLGGGFGYDNQAPSGNWYDEFTSPGGGYVEGSDDIFAGDKRQPFGKPTGGMIRNGDDDGGGTWEEQEEDWEIEDIDPYVPGDVIDDLPPDYDPDAWDLGGEDPDAWEEIAEWEAWFEEQVNLQEGSELYQEYLDGYNEHNLDFATWLQDFYGPASDYELPFEPDYDPPIDDDDWGSFFDEPDVGFYGSGEVPAMTVEKTLNTRLENILQSWGW
jgi:hypothetical protein